MAFTHDQSARVRISTVLIALVLGMASGAAPVLGAAPDARKPAYTLPGPASFQETPEHGFLVDVWIEDSGPYTFAIDTGAGVTMVSERAAATAGLKTAPSRVKLQGLADTATQTRETRNCRVDLGARGNRLPCRSPLLVVSTLPDGVDGILDPADAFAPFGFVLDIPRSEIRAFDPKSAPLSATAPQSGTVVVPWLGGHGDPRPFVALADGRRALIDTGSGLGFAVTENVARKIGLRTDRPSRSIDVRDLAGSRISAQRVAPATIQIGDMEFVRVPTDVLYGASDQTPILLGRDALRPFELTFDPSCRRIRMAAR